MRLVEALSYKPVELGFGTSGLRALVKDMTDLECYINVLGFLHFLEENDGFQKGETLYLAGDLRESTPRIMQVVAQACKDFGSKIINCGLIPTPAIALYAYKRKSPCIMVTGSHIPADRNGIKFYKREGEVLKKDEMAIQNSVARVRNKMYETDSYRSFFTEDGGLKRIGTLPKINSEAEQEYIERYLDFIPKNIFKGKKIIVYQQSAVGRDILTNLLINLGAEAIPIERAEQFIPIDTENVTDYFRAKFKSFAEQYTDSFAIVSTDGDSDRPFVIDETGTFHRGDVLGCVVAKFLGAKFAATPISSNDAVDDFAKKNDIENVHTKIGSPFVIVAMAEADTEYQPVVGWEVNGGFLTGSEIKRDDKTISPLPTRDAVLPILCALSAAVERDKKVSELFAALPKRFTGGGLIDDVPTEKIEGFKETCRDLGRAKELTQTIFEKTKLGDVKAVDTTDGLRVIFKSRQVIHLRPSGNAPQFRVYTNTGSQRSADELADAAIKPGGYIETLLDNL